MVENVETKTAIMKKTELGMDENIEGALCYLLGFVTGIIFLILEKDNKFIKFHAVQSIAIFLPLWVIAMLIGSTMFWSFELFAIFSMISTLVWLISLILWVILMFKAYQGEKFKLPITGDIAERQAAI